MDIIRENLWILLVAAGGIANWLLKGRNEEEVDAPPESTPPLENRRPKTQTVTMPPPLKRMEVGPQPEFVPISNQAQAELERQAAIKEKLAESRAVKKAKRQKAESKREKKVEPMTSIKARLRNKSELRQAVVVKEILDRPLGLR